MTQTTDGTDDIHQHSGWWLPFAVLLAILVLSAFFLLYDLRPGMGSRSGRTGDVQPVHLTVGKLRLSVPANYLDNGAVRDGSAQQALTLSALLPDMRGYSTADAQFFRGNPPDSPLVRLFLRAGENGMNAAERLQRIYRPYLADPDGKDGGFGLTQYVFQPGSGYGRSDLFAGRTNGRMLLFLCERADQELPSPNCLASGQATGDVGVSWRFKRAYLARWREIADGVDRLMAHVTAR